MFLRNLIWLLALFGFVWVVRRLFSGPSLQRRETRRSDPVPTRGEDAMVRDRICNTFLPRSRALTLAVENEQLYFCSERCRKAHLERQAS